MFTRYQRTEDDDPVRRAFRGSGPFTRRWAIPDEDLEAYLGAEYDISDSNESPESVEARETNPLLAAGERTPFTRSNYNGDVQRQVLARCHLILKPRNRRWRSPISCLLGTEFEGLGYVALCYVALALILLGGVYLWSPVLKTLLFPKEQDATSTVQGLN